jgi:hypothetical protein
MAPVDVSVWQARWARMSRWQRVAVVAAAGLLLCNVLDGTVLAPLRRRLHALRHEVQEIETRLAATVVAGTQAGVVAEAYERYRPYAPARVSPEVVQASVLAAVEGAVRESGMSLLSLRPAIEQGGAGGTEHAAPSVSITVEGFASPRQLLLVLHRLQRSELVLKVTRLSLRVSEAKTLRVTLVVSPLLLLESVLSTS